MPKFEMFDKVLFSDDEEHWVPGFYWKTISEPGKKDHYYDIRNIYYYHCKPYTPEEKIDKLNREDEAQQYKINVTEWIKKYNITTGTVVRITNSAENNQFGWSNKWIERMTDCVDCIGIIIDTNLDKTSGILVLVPLSDKMVSFYFPYYVLTPLKLKVTGEFTVFEE